MANERGLNKIFLSASIPSPERNEKYYTTADVVAIRDAVRALATVVIPKAHLIWGGHPSITPLIRFILDKLNVNLKQHVTLYQSSFFQSEFPEDNSAVEDIRLTPKLNDRPSSLAIMRKELIEGNEFKVGIFIGGMEGVEEEFEMFIKAHPQALILPVASTGAAAKIIFDSRKSEFDSRLSNDFAYMSLFRDLLANYLP